jgi:hypothetical protein
MSTCGLALVVLSMLPQKKGRRVLTIILCALSASILAHAGGPMLSLDDRGRFIVDAPTNTRSTITLPENIKIVTLIDTESRATWECTWQKNGNKLWVKPNRLATRTTIILLYREGVSGPSSFIRLRLNRIRSSKEGLGKDGPSYALPLEWHAAYEKANPLHMVKKDGDGYRIGTAFFEKTMVLLPETAALEEVKDTSPNQESSATWSTIWLKGKNALFVEPVFKHVKPATYIIRLKNGSAFPLILMPPSGTPAFDVVFVPAN